MTTRTIITDLGWSQATEWLNADGSPTGEFIMIHRYAAWQHVPAVGKNQVVDTSNDLHALCQKYGVPVEHVVKLRDPRS